MLLNRFAVFRRQGHGVFGLMVNENQDGSAARGFDALLPAFLINRKRGVSDSLDGRTDFDFVRQARLAEVVGFRMRQNQIPLAGGAVRVKNFVKMHSSAFEPTNDRRVMNVLPHVRVAKLWLNFNNIH